MTTKQAASRAPGTLIRVATERTPRRVAFWNVASGAIMSDRAPVTAGARVLSPRSPLSTVLDLIAASSPQMRTRVLFLIGGETVASEPPREWWSEPVARGWRYDGYEIAAASGDGGHLNAGTYTNSDGVTVDVRMSARWFPNVSDPAVCVQAWNTLTARVRLDFGNDAALLTTPATTGLDLLHRSLPRAPHGTTPLEWPAAPDALRETLYHNIGQGRMQVCALPGADPSGPRYTLDGRWMYAACVSHLPVGVPTHDWWLDGADPSEAYYRYVTAWYRVRAWVPNTWNHLGLIPERRDGVTVWPDTPGYRIAGAWVSGAELAVALGAGWPVLIYERWAYPNSEHTPGADPARTWTRTLRAMRAGSTEATYGVTADPMAGAIRHCLIDTVGIWHRREGQRLRVTPYAEMAGPAHHLDTRAGLAYWYEAVPLSRHAQPWQRPEWSATVWGRARARLHTAMLRIPRHEIVALRSDAIITTRQYDWPDDGQPGTFRLKEAH